MPGLRSGGGRAAFSRSTLAADEQRVQDGHPHRDAVRDLRLDDAARVVGERPLDLDVAVAMTRFRKTSV